MAHAEQSPIATHCHQQVTCVDESMATASHARSHSSLPVSFGGQDDVGCIQNCLYKQRSEPISLLGSQQVEGVSTLGTTLTVQALLVLGPSHAIPMDPFPQKLSTTTVVLRQ